MTSTSKRGTPTGKSRMATAAGPRVQAVGIDATELGSGKLLPERIYEQLLEQIASGRIARGDRLHSENTLAQSFGVSRPTIRKALFRLQADGIVRSRKGSGNYVEEIPSPHIVDLKPGTGNISDMLLSVEFRVAIEGDAAALAALRRTDVELAELNEIMARQEQLLGAPLADVHDADIAFHTLIADASRNRLFSEAIRKLYVSVMNSWLLWHRMATDEYGKLWRTVLKEHRAVLGAIRDSDADAARAAMRAHLTKGRRRILKTSSSK
ncbi:MAG: FadR family transcriptional regulator [Hyphomicrobiales bacterium]|nr:FadR family transcriptional regulator [Hyphomicrobiales bacterium]